MARSITPLWWYSMCLVVDPDGLTLYVDNETICKPAQNKPLRLSGSLVLGQDQDGLDKGYAPHQAFIGKVTGLTLWTSVLQPGDVQGWLDCADVKVPPLFTWASVIFNTHGNFTMEEAEFCSSRTGLNKNNLFVFPGQKKWQEVYDILKNMELEFVVPKNEEEVQILSKLLGEHSDYCKPSVYDYESVWIGLRCQGIGSNFLDVNTNQNISYAVWDQKSLMKMENGVGNDCHAAQDKNFMWHTEVGKTKLCYAGVRRTAGTMYNLLGLGGLELERCKDINFVLAGYKENELYFHSGCGFWIWRNGTGQWRLYDSINKNNIANLYVEHDSPFGVQNWVFVKGTSEVERQLTFSFCREFTCTDGSCIPQIHRCDGANNCTDGRDERNCHTTSKAINQSLASPPPELFLDVHIRLNRITNIDLLGMKFDVDFFIQMEWLDQRLKYHNLVVHKRNFLTFADDSSSEQLWSPSVVVTNSLKAEVAYRERPNIYCKGQGRQNGEGNARTTT
ncbi:uncharacterized protein [Macrobrachium rosenbergii]|uniref:uncharacterized protein n=1 Tax=Macrobrachium rosenbergii TaxID=79674 RepID=UPI0034D685E8